MENTAPNPPSSGQRPDADRSPWATVFFAVLFFLGSADSVFTLRIHHLNFRWGQAVLLVAALAALLSGQALKLLRSVVANRGNAFLAVAAWAAFVVAYVIACLHSPERHLTGIKLVWGIFNIGGAAMACLGLTRQRRPVVDGMLLAYLGIALIIWVDAIVIYWGGLPGPIIGLAQRSFLYEGVTQMRPHAFYYEPSYAGAALAFVVMLSFPIVQGMKPWLRVAIPGFLLATTVVISARTGFIAAGFGLLVAVGVALVRRTPGALRTILKSGAVATLLLVIFFAPTAKSRSYAGFIAGPLGPAGMMKRIFGRKLNLNQKYDPKRIREGSERDRLLTAIRNMREWMKHPLLGNGVVPAPVTDATSSVRELRPKSIDTWIEVGMESGLLGVLTFLAAILLTIRAALRSNQDPRVIPFLIAAWAAHFLLNLNFTQTFPRLDYWIIFFASLRILIPEAQAAAQPQPGSGVVAAGRFPAKSRSATG